MWLAGMLTACGLGFGPADSGAPADDTPKVSEARIRITPVDGARDVEADDPFTVEAEDGRLTSVHVEDGDGEAVEGVFTADRSRWHARSRLSLSEKYTVDAVAEDTGGRRAAKHAVFTTLVPKNTLIGYFTPEDGQTVGTGMIVSLDFNRPVADREAVERAVSVGSSPAVEIAPHWFGNRRLDFRPRERWRPGTKVTLSLRLRDVETAPGVYGVQSKDVTFDIGRDQTSTVDAAAHTLTVRRGGQVTRVLPISAGAPSNPTYNGSMVISEKLRLTRMNGDTVGFGGEYDIPDVPHAMRLTRSGTFVHGSYWAAPGTFGAANTSHGCVGLFDVKGGGTATPAGWFFAHSLVGDLITVVNSHDRTVSPDNGLGGWNMAWEQWAAGA
ncbi:L,D-transpeptidase family protein [Streptomyces sp. SID8377]|nr:Ig-like domain-containing protein [Streptomyces sp. SID8377]MYX34270.1 L,D-transpeptidase family protein [Streptomyces sp. SID8377]